MLYYASFDAKVKSIVGSVVRFGTGFRNGCLIGSKEYALKGVG